MTKWVRDTTQVAWEITPRPPRTPTEQEIDNILQAVVDWVNTREDCSANQAALDMHFEAQDKLLRVAKHYAYRMSGRGETPEIP